MMQARLNFARLGFLYCVSGTCSIDESLNCVNWVLALLVLLAAPRLWAQGPPYQTDDPVPVDLHHYEFYIFGAMDGTPVEADSAGPAFEFNWGALPRVQLHAILPFGAIARQTSGLSSRGRRGRAPLG